ncbi:hypothetical protein H072_1130 [Dactylellina haptotyla CBS 200.50]|uniref:Ubiquitin-like domain-containing protein n=1 Tax=Dactylellina haptotyla (strain CBS 200.50) TaxID=1284197 RepID=S8APW6_DACHA|nr:hypothetical protein H072_1130 [Dactylellina haptotyla CBS 200.50]
MELDFDGSRHQPPKYQESTGFRNPFGIALEENKIVVDRRLEITFRRTIRVPDNDETSHLPPDLGEISLTNANEVANNLPDTMAEKGGLLMAMYNNEAMWIDFHLRGDPNNFPVRRHYAIKIYAGGINVVSGEPENETTATTLRRRNRLAKGESVQDYMVVPGQPWIDGIAIGRGKVRQFVATPLGKGFTVEGQMTGSEDVGGLQFEIIGTKRGWENFYSSIGIFLKTLTGRTVSIRAGRDWTIETLKEYIEDETDCPIDQQRLVWAGRQLEDGRTVGEYGIKKEDTIHMVLRLRGGGYAEESEIGLGAGGKIHQTIIKDPKESEEWDKDNIIAFNVQILNAKDYTRVTGRQPPQKPLSATDYAEHGGYFLEYQEDETEIYGDFSQVKSIGHLTDQFDKKLTIQPNVIKGKDTQRGSSGGSQFLGTTENAEVGPLEEYLSKCSDDYRERQNILCMKVDEKSFRTLAETEAALRRRQFASFC